jgi:hypothetical protein
MTTDPQAATPPPRRPATRSRPADMVERMRAVASGGPRATAAASTPSMASPTTTAERRGPRAHRVRYTLDLEPTQHRFLKRASLDFQTDASAIVRALLSELEDDPELRVRIAGRVERRY